MKILIINGPSMNMLGIREPEVYGKQSYWDLVNYIDEKRGRQHELSFIQSNSEGEIIDAIQQAYFDGMDGIVINPGAYSHTSIAIMDALKSVPVACVEVHISDPMKREEYRHRSYVSEAAKATVTGKGFDGYIEAIDLLTD